jgi:hypothetical protein
VLEFPAAAGAATRRPELHAVFYRIPGFRDF